MKISKPLSFAALKMRSMFSTVLFTVTLWPTAPHARPLSLKTSICGSMKTTAVSFFIISMVFPPIIYTAYRYCCSVVLSARKWPAYLVGISSLAEREQILVDLVLMRRAHTVRRAVVNFELGVFDQLRRQHRRRADWHDLVIVTVQDESRHVDLL